jgi:eukaryotic-like serine/threonine-protein kinase
MFASVTSQTERIAAALVGRYRIERHLGEGGMATVYLAEDLKHDRRVALKLLKPELAAVLGADRFVQEIKTTAALQHPHILPLFDSGTADGFLFYVMPFIDGETLRDKLNRETQLSVEAAVRIARDVADALDYAHRHGVIHRDIKPENILLHDGRPMVVDFGIALAVSAAAGGRMTETGLSMGTPHYMSPEQATAEKEITARSDIYSLGSVLYEMLAGQPPHLGGSAQQIVMKIIAEPVQPVTTHRKSVPANVAAAVATSLEKLPADRFESAKLFADALGNPAYANADIAGAAGPSMASRGGVPVRVLVATSVIAVAVAMAATRWFDSRNVDVPTVVHFAFSTESSAPTLTHLVVSPDGQTVVYSMRDSAGRPLLFARPLNDLRQRAIAGTEGAQSPFFSPDGRSIGFRAGRLLKKVPIDGGTATTLAELAVQNGASWGPDGIVVSSEGRLVLVPRDGGTPVPLVRGDSTPGFWPVVLPGGKAVVYSTAAGVDAPLAVMNLSTGRRTNLDLSGVPVGIAAGSLIYARWDGALMGAPFDAGARRKTGGERVVVAELRRDANTGATAVGLSADGTLAYVTGSEILQAVVVNLQGVARPLPIPPGGIDNLRYSPDGRRLAADVSSGGRRDVYTFDVESGAERRVTDDGTRNIRAAWSPDGTRILYQTNRGGQRATLWWQPADGSGVAEQLAASPGKDIWEGELTSDGKNVVYRTGLVPGDIVYRRLAGDTAEKVIATTRFNENGPRSHDGRWVAYASDESGRMQVYVRPFPGPGAQVPVSVTGGNNPVWSRDGRKIFFVNERQLVAASVVTSPSFSVTARDILFEGDYRTGFRHASYDVAPDGKSFVMLRRVGGNSEQIVVLHNWAAELQARAKGTSLR